MDKNKRGLTKAQSQAVGLTGDAKRKAAVKLRADRAKQEAARKREAERKAAEKRKMKMVDRAVLLGGSVTAGAGIGNKLNKLADRSIKKSAEALRKAAADKLLKQTQRKNQANRRGDMMARVGKRKAEEILRTKRPSIPTRVNRKDGSSKEGEKSNNKTKFEKQAEKLLKESRLLGLKSTYKKDQAKPVNRKDGSPKTGEEIIANEKLTHTEYIEKSSFETGKKMMLDQARRDAKDSYPRRRRGVGIAKKGFGKALQ